VGVSLGKTQDVLQGVLRYGPRPCFINEEMVMTEREQTEQCAKQEYDG
jgi:hypothetical protein